MEYFLTTENNRTTITLWGRFDSRRRQEFLTAFQQALKESTNEIVIDLQKVSFIDSTAVGLLMVAHQKCASPQKGLSLCVANGPVKQTLDYLKVSDILPVNTSQ
ncbi:MAG: hypothetical protein NPIRA02_31080 [Nitrospirales bacterium]|nr:MAG: hypothetical protein NPIRA02_31080 [Nitrospirales bacterium]